MEIGRRLGKAIQGVNCVWSVASEPMKFVEHKLRCHVEFLWTKIPHLLHQLPEDPLLV